MANVRRLAKQAGVSIASVSRVLNNHPRVSEEVRTRVLAAASRAHYVPKVGRRSTTNIALLYTGEPSLGSPFDAALIAGMNDAMEEFGFDLIILDARRSRRPSETFTQMFARKGVRGVVMRTSSETRALCDRICAEGFPVVVVGQEVSEEMPVSFVRSDSRGPSREAVDHLIDLGHRRIAIVINVVEDSDHADRVQGWREALEAAEIEPDPRLIIRTPAYRQGGRQAIRRALAMSDRPTAVYLTDPMAAVGALHAALSMGVRVPEDLSLVGFDDAELRYATYPTLTSVCQDGPALGRAAFAALHQILAHHGLETEEVEDGVRLAPDAGPFGADPRPGSTEEVPVIRQTLPAWLEVHDTTGPAPDPREVAANPIRLPRRSGPPDRQPSRTKNKTPDQSDRVDADA